MGIFFPLLAPQPSGKAEVCKISIRQFESARCLSPSTALIAP